MTQSEYDDFLPLFEEANRLYLHGDLVGALTLATEGQNRFPDESAPLHYLRATLKARMGDPAGALAALGDAISKGYWYPDGRWASDAFAPLQQSGEFKRLRAISNEREAKALAEASPKLTVLAPELAPKPNGNDTTPARPLLLALHGNGYGRRHEAPYWRAAKEQGWLVGLAQSGQVIGYDAYAWSDQATAEAELRAHVETVSQQHMVKADSLVLAGKSQGAEIAIQLALTSKLPVSGFIAIVPSGPLMLRTALWEDLVQASTRHLRGYVVLGGREAHFAAGGRRLIEMLRAKGITCALDYHPGVRHEYPINFRARLPFMLDFVSPDAARKASASPS